MCHKTSKFISLSSSTTYSLGPSVSDWRRATLPAVRRPQRRTHPGPPFAFYGDRKANRGQRRNAQNSTGPRSVEGKAASSRNALKTGLYCRGIIIGKESSAQLEELEAAYSAEYAPATPAERALVDSLIHYEWLLRRYRWLETETWRATYAKLTAAQCEDHSWTGHAFIEQPAIARIHRLRNQTQRLYHETLGQLHALQADGSTAEPDPQPTEESTPSPEIGFVSSNSFEASLAPQNDASPAPGPRFPTPVPEPTPPQYEIKGS